jgi:hypothetical protein
MKSSKKLKPAIDEGRLTTLEEKIIEVLKRELRLVSQGGDTCAECGEALDETWMVKPGNIEHCAKLIAEAVMKD